jgi:transposase-like protein
MLFGTFKDEIQPVNTHSLMKAHSLVNRKVRFRNGFKQHNECPRVKYLLESNRTSWPRSNVVSATSTRLRYHDK